MSLEKRILDEDLKQIQVRESEMHNTEGLCDSDIAWINLTIPLAIADKYNFRNEEVFRDFFNDENVLNYLKVSAKSNNVGFFEEALYYFNRNGNIDVDINSAKIAGIDCLSVDIYEYCEEKGYVYEVMG